MRSKHEKNRIQTKDFGNRRTAVSGRDHADRTGKDLLDTEDVPNRFIRVAGSGKLELGIALGYSRINGSTAKANKGAGRKTEPLAAELKKREEELTGYILANPERFIKPRQHVTEYGKYGLRQAAGLVITDEEAVKASVRLQHIPALIVIEKLDKKALEKAISEGVAINGCEMRRGEIASYTVAKALLE